MLHFAQIFTLDVALSYTMSYFWERKKIFTRTHREVGVRLDQTEPKLNCAYNTHFCRKLFSESVHQQDVENTMTNLRISFKVSNIMTDFISSATQLWPWTMSSDNLSWGASDLFSYSYTAVIFFFGLTFFPFQPSLITMSRYSTSDRPITLVGLH
jgi:hypothetical protein